MGISLYSSFEESNFATAAKILVVDSVKEFVNAAAMLVKPSTRSLSTSETLISIKTQLWQAINSESGLFNGRKHVRALSTASSAVFELEQFKPNTSKSPILKLTQRLGGATTEVMERRKRFSSYNKWNVIVGRSG